MTGRRSTTTTQPTPLEEVEPTTTPPPDTAPEPGTAPVEDPPASPDPDGPDDTPRDPFAGFRAIARQFATDPRGLPADRARGHRGGHPPRGRHREGPHRRARAAPTSTGASMTCSPPSTRSSGTWGW
jgi:hypothetical protein